jgi:AraC family transcriptional regulator, positive regulator of tynA and feaB
MPFWSTEELPTKEQFGFWREVLCEAFITLDPRRQRETSGAAFAGSVTANLISEVNVTSLQHEAHRIVRGPAEIRKKPLEYYFVNMQIDGQVCAEQRGRSVLIGPDEFYIVDSTEPYDLNYRGNPKTYSFRIPKAMLDPLIGDSAQLTTKRVSRDTPIGMLAVDFLQSVLKQPHAIPAEAGKSIANIIAEIVALSLGETGAAREPAALGGSARAALLNSILRYINANLQNPTLSVDVVCRRFGISPRYLHRAFEAAELSFGEHVRKLRLQRCASELMRLRYRSIAEVAFSCGFGDISHFNHCFRKQFGLSPREYRTLQRGI